MKKPRTQIEVIQSIRNDWGYVHPSTKTFKDRRKKNEQKYPKRFIEQEGELEDDEVHQ